MTNLFRSLYQIAFRPKDAFSDDANGRYNTKLLYALVVIVSMVYSYLPMYTWDYQPEYQSAPFIIALFTIIPAINVLVLSLMLLIQRTILDNASSQGRLFTVNGKANKPALKEYTSFSLPVQLLAFLVSFPIGWLKYVIPGPLASSAVILALSTLWSVFIYLRLVSFAKLRYGIDNKRCKIGLFIFRVALGLAFNGIALIQLYLKM